MWWWAVAAAETGRLTDPVEPTREVVHLTLDPDAPEYEGKATLSLRVEERLASFHLHSEGLTIRKATLVREEGKELEATATQAEPQLLKIEPEKPLSPGEWTLTLEFDGRLRTSDEALGLYRIEHEGRFYIASQFEAHEARTAWPCFDEPSFKIPFVLSVSLPADKADLVAISNTKIRPERPAQQPESQKKKKKEGEDEGKDSARRTVRFEPTKPISTYALALAVGPYASIDVPDMPVPSKIYTLAGREAPARSLVPELPKLTRWLERWFAEPYPYDKLDVIAVPGFAFGAMENPGAILLNDYYLTSPGLETVARRRSMLHVAGHELGHMWFGNLVTLAWWDDLWLNESFAEWIGDRAVDGAYPELETPMISAEETVSMLEFEARPSAMPLRVEVDPNAVFETVNFAVYDKGSALLDITEAWLGQEAFRAGVRSYIGNYRFATASATDLFSSLGITAGKPVRDVLGPWLDRPGAPSLSFERNADGRIEVRQRRFLLAGSPEAASEPWPVIMQLKIGRPSGAVEVRTVRVDEADQILDLGEVAWLMPAADGLGYFHFTLGEDLDKALLSNLSSLSPVERLRLAAATRLGFLEGTRSVRDVVETLRRFAGEREPEVLRELHLAVRVVVDLARESGDPEAEARAEAWGSAQAREALSQLGPEGSDEPLGRAKLRRDLLAMLADAKEPRALEQLSALAARFLEAPTSVSSDIAPIALTAAMERDSALAKTVEERAARETDPTLRRIFLSAATSAGDFASRRARLDSAVRPEASIPDLMTIWYTAMGEREDRDQLVDWQIANHEVLSAKIPEVQRANLARLGEGCSEARLEKVRAFYLDPSRVVPGTEQVVREIEDSLRGCKALLQLHGPSLSESLTETASR